MNGSDVVEKIAGVGIVTYIAAEFFGLPIQPIVWALIGGCFGMLFARKTGAFGAASAYIAGSLLSALFGHTAAQGLGYWINWSPRVIGIVANASSGLLSVAFHLVLAVFVSRVTGFANKGFDWIEALIPKAKGKK